MAKTIRTYSQWRQEKLTDPERVARYLTAAKRESREAFLHAVKNVIQANQVTKIAKEVGVTRESVYRSFSAEGNPAFYTIDAVLEALDIEIGFSPTAKTAGPLPVPNTDESYPRRRIHKVDDKSPATGSTLAQALPVGTAGTGMQWAASGNTGNINGTVFVVPNAEPSTPKNQNPSFLNPISSARIYELGQQSTGVAHIENRI
jgi:probable addiction module antidote protein